MAIEEGSMAHLLGIQNEEAAGLGWKFFVLGFMASQALSQEAGKYLNEEPHALDGSMARDKEIMARAKFVMESKTAQPLGLEWVTPELIDSAVNLVMQNQRYFAFL